MNTNKINWSMSIVIMLVGSMFAWCIVAMTIGHHRRKIHEKALAIGLKGATREIEERHVMITEHARSLGTNDDIPVHILKWHEDIREWGFWGSGTQLAKFPGWVLTAYHVFENVRGQFAIRIIGSDEITGAAAIIPIVKVDQLTQTDDTVMCAVSKSAKEAPVIYMPYAEKMFHKWDSDRDYHVVVRQDTIRLNTYPEKALRSLATIEVMPGLHHVFFDWNIVSGESGTAGKLEGQNDPAAYLVVIQNTELPKSLIDALTPENKKLFNWHEGKKYGIAALVGVK